MLAKLIFQVTHLTKIRTFSEFLQEQYKISGLLGLIFFSFFNTCQDFAGPMETLLRGGTLPPLQCQ